jgi:hypothetical protein
MSKCRTSSGAKKTNFRKIYNPLESGMISLIDMMRMQKQTTSVYPQIENQVDRFRNWKEKVVYFCVVKECLLSWQSSDNTIDKRN